MTDVRWIKITTSMFDDEKIRVIEAMPEADSILVCWIKLICLAGKTNANGFIFLTEQIPYTEETLANVFGRPLNTVKMAMEFFRKFGMVEYDEKGFLYLPNWVSFYSTARNWKGGITPLIQKLRNSLAYIQWRHSVYVRESYCCQQCGQYGGRLQAHHIIPVSVNRELIFDIANGATLCCDCHRNAHGRGI